MLFNDEHISISNIYVMGDLTFLVILLGKKYSSLHWCIKYMSSSKHWKIYDHTLDDEWTINT